MFYRILALETSTTTASVTTTIDETDPPVNSNVTDSEIDEVTNGMA